MEHNRLFAFESDFVASLRCIPMAVRRKLDRIGIKLTLRQWSRLTQIERRELLDLSCETQEEQAVYQQILLARVQGRTGEQPRALNEPVDALWEAHGELPEQVAKFAQASGLRPLTAVEWQKLTELERFVLVKLSRDNHDNVNFTPAMREFSLAP